MTRRRLIEPEWFAYVRVGDVIKSPSGMYRVARAVGRDRFGRLTAIEFTIQRCSWTKRPLTTYSRQDLKRGWSYVGVRMKLDTDIDRKISASVDARRSVDCLISCCAVRGVA